MNSPLLYNAKGEPIQQPPGNVQNPGDAFDSSSGREYVPQGQDREQASEREEEPSWEAGGPLWLGSQDRKRCWPVGVSVSFDRGYWVLRDEFLDEPVLGTAREEHVALGACDMYAPDVRRRARRVTRGEQLRRSRL